MCIRDTNYVGVVAGDSELEKKIKSALSRGLVVNGHAPLLVRAPVNSFEFHSCERTPQAEYLMC